MASHALNPLTNRCVLIGSYQYKRLVKLGHILEPMVKETSKEEPPKPAPEPESKSDPTPDEDNVPKSKPVSDPPLAPKPKRMTLSRAAMVKARVADKLTDVVRDNQDQLRGLTQAETDALLKKLLVRKLSISSAPAKSTRAPTPAPVKKKKKGKKFKVSEMVEPSSSEDDSSEEVSDSD
jgi:hypothetical protein